MSLLDKNLISSPEKEFIEFCCSRLEGLALTHDEETLNLYQEAREKGEEILREMETDS